MSFDGLLGRKIGMTQIFEDDGTAVPVTVIDTASCTVVQVKTKETDGYDALQLGFGERKHVTKALKGHMKDFGQFQVLREFRTENAEAAEAGGKVSCGIFEVGELVDVSGKTKGKGFGGVVKRWGFRGGPKTHGQSDRHRSAGSIGAGTSPGRVIKGLKMAGHMGTGEATARNLKVVRVDADKGVLFVRGPVPGNEGTVVRVRKSPTGKAAE